MKKKKHHPNTIMFSKAEPKDVTSHAFNRGNKYPAKADARGEAVNRFSFFFQEDI